MDRLKKVLDPSSQLHPFLFFTFLLWSSPSKSCGLRSIGPARPSHRSDKDYSFLPLRIVHDEGSSIACMIQPVTLLDLHLRASSSSRKIYTSHAQKSSQIRSKKRSRSATVEKVQHFAAWQPNTLALGSWTLPEARPRDRWHRPRPVQTVSLSSSKQKTPSNKRSRLVKLCLLTKSLCRRKLTSV